MINNIIFFLIRIFGAFLNRVRGGLKNPDTGDKFVLNKLWQPLFYGLFIGFTAYHQNWLIPFYIEAVINGAGMYGYAQLMGWGTYRGAISTRYCSGAFIREPEVKFIDKIIKDIKNDFWYGIAGLSIRLGLTSCLLALCAWDYRIAPVGFIMPFVTWFAEFLADKYRKITGTNPPKLGWNIAEWFEGSVLWGWVYLCLYY